MKVKIFDKIYEVEHIFYCKEEKGTYYYLKGKKTPYCDLDYDIEIINETKELSPLEALVVLKQTIFHHTRGCLSTGEEQAFKRLETALKRLEKIETTTHSVLREDISKKLKALEIIKENLNIDEILLAIKGVCKASDYDLVKEVLL